ncbi:PQQ-dependent catabolism-associated CXXCW motif protein [Lutibaculum baratangense]|uniref:Rhodanese-related sulfurtransferase n=1 Tax=Lutibaculum baratangense AMV1 TaxID=631454 RepID=V4TIH3_9HYPH|nr:PQQ-dependent catabolism-associated CXXCW motif protein [Lutibaculum baratangense]ESR25798.1 Rhodanese-related sulfurtransferase [Lutibaculum baratangense AMV1]
MKTRIAAALLLAWLPQQDAGANEPVPEPPGFRTEDYRSPVPATLAGATVLDTARAHEMWLAGAAIFVDVLPRPPRPDLPEGTYWRPPQRESIPGSTWLPNTGYGVLSPEMAAYFADELDRLATQHPGKPLVIFCLRDCWMSWNAAKRALVLGHAAVAWYPDGTDGWAESGHPLERIDPVPRPGAAE